MDLRDFQLYLLSMMRGKSAIQNALKMLSATEDEAKEAGEAAKQLNLGAFPPPHISFYSHILGEPRVISEEAEGWPQEKYVPVRFKLPLWNQFEFLMEKHLDGHTFMLRFVRDADAFGPPPLHSVADLAPWKFTYQEIVERLGILEEADQWWPLRDIYCKIPDKPGGRARRYLLCFDFDLLQLIIPD